MTTITQVAALSPVKPARSRIYKWIVAMGLVLAIAGAVFWRYRHNFHAVVPGRVFRSNQLDGDELEAFIQRYHFHTILNLRGANPDADWYKQECAIAKRHQIRHFDLPTDSVMPPTPDELSQLLKILTARDALPILVHCQSGIDRTGIVAAVCILLLEDSATLAQARSQIHWRYGHLPWARSTRNNLAFLDSYQDWLSNHGLSHSPSCFRQWMVSGGFE